MIQIPAILTGFSTRVDGGASIRFATNELSDTDVLELKRHQGKFGYVLFKENEFSAQDIPKEDAEDKDKTPSKRLRASLYVLHQQLGSPKPFDQFYKEQMDVIIERIKAHLD